MRRYLRVYWALVKASFTEQTEYHTNFWFEIIASLLSLATGLLFFHFVYRYVDNIAGWNVFEVYFLIGTNALINALYGMNIGSKMGDVARSVKEGTLDTILLKPVSSQFWFSAKGISLRSCFEILASLGIMAYVISHLEIHITFTKIIIYFSLTLCSVLLKYAFSFIIVTTSFWVVRVDALRAIFMEIFRFSGYPAEIFRGATKILFTFVFPMAIIANVPARVFVKVFHPQSALYLLFLVFMFILLSNLYWHLGLRHYQSAGG
ncbi:MAG: ABC-2 family transporter protein [Chloroflexota bacterium]